MDKLNQQGKNRWLPILALFCIVMLLASCAKNNVLGNLQNTYRPRSFTDPESIMPAIALPIDTICRGGSPDAWLGLTLAELIDRFPVGLQMIDDSGEHVIYQNQQGVLFEMLDQRVVVVRQEVRGNWRFPHEPWFAQLRQRLMASAITYYNEAPVADLPEEPSIKANQRGEALVRAGSATDDAPLKQKPWFGRYHYSTFMFTIHYNPSTDSYLLRFDFLPATFPHSIRPD
ncbi:MAG: hypothetical protein KBT04_01695 [Bacteroidales bacterium]|nr:hypothetical protein [Candidatus Colimorpha onthohippi]